MNVNQTEEKANLVQFSFSPEIQGLRAIAVCAVIINHINKDWLPSGYLGVDVFFVISGFVIQKSISQYNTYGWRQVLEFLLRRLRRIYPSLIFLVLTVCLLDAFLGIASQQSIRTGATSLLGSANLYLIRIGDDYFGLSAESNIFTHTWSLGLETQYYFFIAIIFLFFPLFIRSWSFLICLACISFLFYLSNSVVSHLYSYYLPFSRFFELLLGAALYVALSNGFIKLTLYSKPIVRFCSLLMICLVIAIFFTTLNQFIESKTIIIIITTSALIFWSHKFGILILRMRLLQHLGTISFSLYLVHYPVIKFLNTGKDVWLTFGLMVPVIYILSLLNFSLIETRFYNKNSNFSMKGLAFLSLFLVSGFIGTFLYSNIVTGPDYFAHPKPQDGGFESFCIPEMENLITNNCILESSEAKRLFFVGDSHSKVLMPAMKLLNEQNNYSVHMIQLGGLFTTKLDATGSHSNLSLKGRNTLSYIKKQSNSGDVIILTNQLSTWFSTTYNDSFEDHRLKLGSTLLSQEQALKEYLIELNSIAEFLNSIGISIIIFAPFPDFPDDPSKCFSYVLGYIGGCVVDESEQLERRKKIVESLNDLSSQHENVIVFDPFSLICKTPYCSSFSQSGDPLYRDDDHVNSKTALLVYPELLGTINLL